MNREHLRAKFPNATEAFLRLNEDVDLGAVQDRNAKPKEPPLEPCRKAQKVGNRSPSYRVAIIAVTARELDDDNLIGGCKPLRDSIAQHLGCADDKKSIRFSYAQVVSGGEGGTIVMIEPINKIPLDICGHS